MKYGDFSSLVQLGVSLHLAMVAIQHYGDIGAGPLAHTIERIRRACAGPGKRPSPELASELDALEADFKKFKLRMFAEFKEYWAINTATAVVLGGFLALISWRPTTRCHSGWPLYSRLFQLFPLRQRSLRCGATPRTQ